MVSRAFYQWSGGTSQDHEALAWFASAQPQQMGPLVRSFRGGIAGRAWWRSLGTMLAFAAFLTVIALVAAPAETRASVIPGVLVLAVAVWAFVMVCAWATARLQRTAVHAHGLVVSAPGSGPEAIPWATIDPGRIFVATTVRAMTRMPVALYRQQAVLPPGVVINGWTKRPLGGSLLAENLSSGYRYQPTPSDAPFGWWQIGATDPQALLSTIEAAMVADGYPAAGLTPFVLSRAVTARDLRREPALQAERGVTDPVIGLPAR